MCGAGILVLFEKPIKIGSGLQKGYTMQLRGTVQYECEIYCKAAMSVSSLSSLREMKRQPEACSFFVVKLNSSL